MEQEIITILDNMSRKFGGMVDKLEREAHDKFLAAQVTKECQFVVNMTVDEIKDKMKEAKKKEGQ